MDPIGTHGDPGGPHRDPIGTHRDPMGTHGEDSIGTQVELLEVLWVGLATGSKASNWGQKMARIVLLPHGLWRGKQTSRVEVAPNPVAQQVANFRDCSGVEGCQAHGTLEPSTKRNWKGVVEVTIRRIIVTTL